MRVLWVGTKAPWPPVDGGRLVAATTIDALRAAGHEVTVVVSQPRSWLSALAVGSARRLPFTIARHTDPVATTRVATLLAEGRFDVVHAEQLHAVANCRATAAARQVPVVLRAQNVESELWSWRASITSAPASLLLRGEASRLARFEGDAVRSVAGTIALTARDASRLAALAGATAGVRHLAAPFPAGRENPGRALPGEPAIVVPGSAGWSLNSDGVAWLVREVWPRIAARLPNAVLHVFAVQTPSADRIVQHPSPADSTDAFPTDAIVVVPLRAAIGVRMRILEAWARGLPVVATHAAADGLSASSAAMLVAATADEMAAAIARIHAEPDLRRALVAAGRATLRTHHDPGRIAGELAELYASVASAARARA